MNIIEDFILFLLRLFPNLFLRLSLLLSFFVFSHSTVVANAALKEVDMSIVEPHEIQYKNWVYSENPKFKGPKELNDLFNIRVLEVNKQWIECSEKSLFSAQKHLEIIGWVAVQGLDCLSQVTKINKQSIRLAEKWFSFLINHLELLGSGTWKESLIANLIKVQAQNIQSEKSEKNGKNGKKRVSENSKLLENALEFRGIISKLDLSEIYYSIAENQDRIKNAEATSYYLQRSYSLNPSKELAEKLKTLGFTQVRMESSNESLDNIESTAYRKAVDGLEKSRASVDIDPAILFLKTFPGSLKAQSVADKTVSVIQSFVDRIDELQNSNNSSNGVNDFKATLDKLVTQLLECHPLRLLDWAKVLHKKGAFVEAKRMAEKALPSLEGSMNGAYLLYILGRTNYFLGEYQTALNYFSKIILAHSGFSEIGEIRFRVGLLNYRLNDFSKAEEEFREVARNQDSRNYELAARYWLIRSMERLGKDTSEETKILFEKFPNSYYGFKLFSEKFGNPLIWPRRKISPLKTKLWMTESDQKSFNRAKKLITVGWYYQASLELNQIFLPPTAENKVIMASWYSKAMSFPSAIKLLGEATDLDIKFRAPEYLDFIYPFAFRNAIESEAKKNGLNPYLIAGLIRQESAFLMKAVSTSQAQGLMQMIPPTALEVAQELKVKNFNAATIFEPKMNIQFGTHYIAKMIRNYENNIPLGLAAYNAGPVRLKKYLVSRNDTRDLSRLSTNDFNSELWIEELPWFETNIYVKSILRNAITYQILETGKTEVQNPLWTPFIFLK
jgi:soluble lytic murein transglycosylase